MDFGRELKLTVQILYINIDTLKYKDDLFRYDNCDYNNRISRIG
jgi:hypothetical protein